MTTTSLSGFVAIPISDVHPSPTNPRTHLEDIDGLAISIKENGLIQPLVVQRIPGREGFQLVAGHRRRLAALKLGWAKVPCIVRRDMLPDEELLAMLVENGQRSDLDPIEEARAFQTLVNGDLATGDIAAKVGRSAATVAGRLALLRLPIAEQEQIRAGHYTLTHASKLIRDVRRAERDRVNPTARPVGRPKGAKTKPYFGDTHPLAMAARARCSCKSKPKVGGVACGECWESVIREDQDATDDEREAS